MFVEVHPCRDLVSDRFPVASFVVRAPADRFFEVACATDPELFGARGQTRRSSSNFYSSRLEGGLMRAPAGEVTWLLPPEQLQRFAGARRLYYAVAHFAGLRGEDARFTISPVDGSGAPFIRLAPDFTGRNLERARLGSRIARDSARYGRSGGLTWGADLVGGQRLGAPAAEYNDGFDPALWRQPNPVEEPEGLEDAQSLTPALVRSNPEPAQRPAQQPNPVGQFTYGRRAPLRPLERVEPAGLEHGPVRLGGGPSPTRRLGEGDSEPEGLEHAADLAPQPVVPVVPPPAAIATPRGIPLTLEEKLRIIRMARNARTRSSSDAAYGWAENGNGDLYFGLLGFSATSGLLGDILSSARERDPAAYAWALGELAESLLTAALSEVPSHRMGPQGGPRLDDPQVVRVLSAAGSGACFVYAQNRTAVEGVVDRITSGLAPTWRTDRYLCALTLLAAALGPAHVVARIGATASPDLLRSLASGNPSLAAAVDGILTSRELYDSVYEGR